jgi:protein subunit release factor B
MDSRSAKFPVSVRKQRELERRMDALGIREDDLKEKFVRSSGRGGQYVNRVATCVMLHHKPSGKRVKCQIARTQGLNRYYARKRLVEKIEEEIRGIESEKRKKIAKIKRQKRKRSKRAKEKMLEQKRKQAEKKVLRKKIEF